MVRWSLLVAVLACTGCFNRYTHVDPPASGEGRSFKGIEHHLDTHRRLHVLQVHGMGDHPSGTDCGADSTNLALQNRIADDLGLMEVADYGTGTKAVEVMLGKSTAGTYTTRRFDEGGRGDRQLYFSCVTWGELGRKIKHGMLELDPGTFHETSGNDLHRAPINRWAKKFVNQSFSDPVMYVGAFGPWIRQALKNAMDAAVSSHAAEGQALFGQGVAAGGVPTVVISDSLGSRVVFDLLCAAEEACRAWQNLAPLQTTPGAKSFFNGSSADIRAVYMLANQLPLLELGNLRPEVESVQDFSVDDMLAENRCYLPLAFPEVRGAVDPGPVEIVAFTDPNDALSYRLSDRFKRRCAGDGNRIRIVNVTMPNPKLRWLFVYSNLARAHSQGFKEPKSRALGYLVDGWPAE